MDKYIVLNEKDNVGIAIDDIPAGYSDNRLTAVDVIPIAHKIMLSDVRKGDSIIKYGYPIGIAKCDIKKGSHVHSHNLETNVDSILSYTYDGENEYNPVRIERTFNGYRRNNGSVGTRNEIWIIPTVGCVNNTAKLLETAAVDINDGRCDGIYAFTHPYGCSQSGDDQDNTRRAIAGLINNPNAGGVLVLSLGCENTGIDTLLPYIGEYDEERIRFLVTQECDDELEKGLAIIDELCGILQSDKREPCAIDELTVGYKCGGSDAFSGITANHICGLTNDILTSTGATTILTEVPEMFGAESLLMKRCNTKAVFDKCVDMINSFKQYFISHDMSCGENPSPGNKAGGITTIEEKSLGCIQKGGCSVVTDVLGYCQRAEKPGLNLLYGPGNDIVAITNLAAAGASIILFTTGRGTPLGAPVPTIKISTNTPLADKKSKWIDFDTGAMTADNDKEMADNLLDIIIDVAGGMQTRNEINGYREIAIFKNGVTL